MGAETQKPAENPQKPNEAPAEKKPDELLALLRKALEDKEGNDSLRNLGDLMYRRFNTAEYTPTMVLSSVREVYNEYKAKFSPPLTLNRFVSSFGPGLVMLCQQKLLDQGGYDLGKFGKKGDGVDGILGRRTGKALRLYYGKDVQPQGGSTGVEQQPQGDMAPNPGVTSAPTFVPVAPPKYELNPPTPISYTPYPQPFPNLGEGSTELIQPYVRGTEKPTLTPKEQFTGQVQAEYSHFRTTLTHKNLPGYFGHSEKEVKERFITLTDPITHGPISFLGRPINHIGKSGPGVNLIMIPFLKMAEEEIRRANINYQPYDKDVGGFGYRTMMYSGKDSGLLSHHAYGLAIDVDCNQNGPENGRGNIPDEVVLAMARAGFAWGGATGPGFSYLHKDPMHFQLRFDAREPEAQALINSSPIGRRYWNAVLPLLPDDYKQGLVAV